MNADLSAAAFFGSWGGVNATWLLLSAIFVPGSGAAAGLFEGLGVCFTAANGVVFPGFIG